MDSAASESPDYTTAPTTGNRPTGHAWTDGSFRKSAGLGWVITSDDQGAGPVINQGSKTLKGKQVAFDAEVIAIEEALKWFKDSDQVKNLVIHPDSTSAITRTSQEHPRHSPSLGARRKDSGNLAG
jgi:ribonuclease HI